MLQAYDVVGFKPGDSKHQGVELSAVDVQGLCCYPKCPRQWRVHFDFGPHPEVDQTEDFCVSMLFPLDESARFYVRPAWDKEKLFVPWAKEATVHVDDKEHGRVLQLQKGQVLVMHAGFAHAGYSSESRNYRLFLRLVTPRYKQVFEERVLKNDPNDPPEGVFTVA